ncbi:hypothetical protein ACFQH2_14055 [Natronoarchaeum sp. GCM10025703]|uniref:hypothetical protein n=1 Tax=unclassified Natronoarchaeum TaxID=2620183 RepID=UPI00361020BD
MIPEASASSRLKIESILSEKNKFTFYWDRIKDLDIPIPKTEIIFLEEKDGQLWWDTSEIISTLNTWGAEEAFVRSNYKSAPHRLRSGSHISKREPSEINRTIESLLSQLSASNWEHGGALVLRQWLDLNFCMRAEHRGCHPEVRFFIEDGEILSFTPREIGSEDICDMQYDHLERIINSGTNEIPLRYAHRVAKEFTEYTWAVDFVMDTNGNWFCTEMGLNAIYWNTESADWLNHCDHNDLEALSPREIHSCALYYGRLPETH